MIHFDPEYTAAYYDSHGERESARWHAGPRGRMAHAIFCQHLRERVRSGDRVLDVGCGPGTFTKVLLSLGARVTCVDVSPVQLEACRTNAPGAEAYELDSITDLSRHGDDAFDCALAMGGVISYCFERAPDAVRELVRVTRGGGLVGLSAMNLLGTVHAFLPKVMATPLELNRRILASGDRPRELDGGHECHMFRLPELHGLLAGAGLDAIELSASGWLVPNDEASIADEGSDEWKLLFDAEVAASLESPGAGTHVIAWGRVPGHGMR